MYEATFVTVEEGLPQRLRDADERVDFDPFARTLRYAGPMTPAARTALRTAADALTLADMGVVDDAAGRDAFVTAFETAVDELRPTSSSTCATPLARPGSSGPRRRST